MKKLKEGRFTFLFIGGNKGGVMERQRKRMLTETERGRQ